MDDLGIEMRTKFQSIQAGRGIAALMVLLFHLGASVGDAKYFNTPALSVPFAFGGSGVEFFFVLSGFIIYTAHQQDLGKPSRLGEYLRKRAARIYPVYWFIFLVIYVTALIVPSLRDTVPHDPWLVFKSLTLVPLDAREVGGTGAPVIIVAWSLQYEMVFYACFAVLIISRAAGAVMAAGLVLGLAYCHGNTACEAFPASFVDNSFPALFVFGIGIAMITARWHVSQTTGWLVFVSGLLAFALVALDQVLKLDRMMNIRTMGYGVASTLIILGLTWLEHTGQSMGSHRWAQLLGDSSYSLYLIHFPVISLFCKVCVYIGLGSMGLAGALAAYVICMVASLAAGILIHLQLERPLTQYLRKYITRRTELTGTP